MPGAISGPTTKTPLPGIGSSRSAFAGAANAIAVTHATNMATARGVGGIFFSISLRTLMAAYAQPRPSNNRNLCDEPSAGGAAAILLSGRTALVCHHTTRDEVIDQRNRPGGKMFRHSRAGKLVVVNLQRGQDLLMVLYRLARPALNRRKHRFGSVTGDLQHQLSKLWRVRGDIDGPVKLVVQPNGPLVVIADIGLLPLGLELLECMRLIVGDVGRGPRGQLPTDVSLHVRDVGDVSPGDRQHHEAAPGLLGDQPFRAQREQRLTDRCDTDPQLRRQ